MTAARQQLLKTFQIDYLSSIDDCRYTGSFTIKKLAIRDLAALGTRKAQLNGGMHHDQTNPGRGVDENTDNFNNMIAHLELSVKEHPKWWDLDVISDVNLIGTVFAEVAAFENSFLSRQADRATNVGNGEGNSETNVQEANASGAARVVVDKEVSAALEP